MNENRPTFIMFCGLPGSGKTTVREKARINFDELRVASTDDLIEQKAAEDMITYSEAFPKWIDWAQSECSLTLEKAFNQNADVVLDQTNLTIKKRKRVLGAIGSQHYRICVVVSCDETLRQARLSERAGKVIPKSVDDVMQASWQTPTLDEGWDAILTADAFLTLAL